MTDVAVEDIDFIEAPTHLQLRKHPDFVGAVGVGIHRPSLDQGGEASSYYKDLAADDDAQDKVSMALTGKNYSELSPAEKEVIDRIILEMSLGLFDVEVVPEGDNVILEDGVQGAYVPGENGEPGTIYVAEGLSPEQYRAVMREEMGEAIAARAEGLGLDIADGDAGNRLNLTAGGKTVSLTETPDLYETKDSDTTTVTVIIDGKKHTFEAKARDTSDPDGVGALDELGIHLDGATDVEYVFLDDGTVQITGTTAAGEAFEYFLTPGVDDNGNATLSVTGYIVVDGETYYAQEELVLTGDDNITDFITDLGVELRALGLQTLIYQPVLGTLTSETAAETDALTWINEKLDNAAYVTVTRNDDGSVTVTGENSDGTSFEFTMTVVIGDDGSKTMTVNGTYTDLDNVTHSVVEDVEVSGKGSIMSFIGQVDEGLAENGFVQIDLDIATGSFSHETANESYVDIVLSATDALFSNRFNDATVSYNENGDVVVTLPMTDGNSWVITYTSSTNADGEKVITITRNYLDADGNVISTPVPPQVVVGGENTAALEADLNLILVENQEAPTTFTYPSADGDVHDVLDWDTIAAENGLPNSAGTPTYEYHADGSFSVTYTNQDDDSTYVVNYVPGTDADGNNYVDVSYTYTGPNGEVTTGASMSDPDGPASTRVYINNDEDAESLTDGINAYLAANDPDFAIPVMWTADGFVQDAASLAAFVGGFDELDEVISESTNVVWEINEHGQYVVRGEKDGQTWEVRFTTRVDANGEQSLVMSGSIQTGNIVDGSKETVPLFANVAVKGEDFLVGMDLLNDRMGTIFHNSYLPTYWSEETQTFVAITDDTEISYSDTQQSDINIDGDVDVENGTVVGEVYVYIDGERVAYSSLSPAARAQIDFKLTDDGGGAFGLNEQGQVIVVDADALVPGEMNVSFKMTFDGLEQTGTMTFDVTEAPGIETGVWAASVDGALQIVAEYIGDGTVDNVVIDANGNMTITGTDADGNAFTIKLTSGVAADGEPMLTISGTVDDPVNGVTEMFAPVDVHNVEPTLDFLNMLFAGHPDLGAHTDHSLFQIEFDPATGGIITKDPASDYRGPYGTETGYGNGHSTYGIPEDAQITEVVSVPPGTGAFGDHDVQIVTYIDAETGETVTAAVDVGEGSETEGYVLTASVTDADGNVTIYDAGGTVLGEFTAVEFAEMMSGMYPDEGAYPDGASGSGAGTLSTTENGMTTLPGHTSIFQESTISDMYDTLAAEGVEGDDILETGIAGGLAWVTYTDANGNVKTYYRWVDPETGEVHEGTVFAGTAEGNALESAIDDYETHYGTGRVVEGAAAVGVFAGAATAAAMAVAWAIPTAGAGGMTTVGAALAAGMGGAAVVAAAAAIGIITYFGHEGYKIYDAYAAGRGEGTMRSLVTGEVADGSPTLTGHLEVKGDDIVTPPGGADEAAADPIAADPEDRTADEIAADNALEEADELREVAEADALAAKDGNAAAVAARNDANAARAAADADPDNAQLEADAQAAETEADRLESEAEVLNGTAEQSANVAGLAAEEALNLAIIATGSDNLNVIQSDPRVIAATAQFSAATSLQEAVYLEETAYIAELLAIELELEAEEARAIADQPGATDAEIANADAKEAEAAVAREHADEWTFQAEAANINYLNDNLVADQKYLEEKQSEATELRTEADYWDQQATALENEGDPGAAAARTKANEADAKAYAAEQDVAVAENKVNDSELEFNLAIASSSDRLLLAWGYVPPQSELGEVDTGYSAYGIPEDATITNQRFVSGEDGTGDSMIYTYTRESEPGVVYTVRIDTDPSSETYGYVLGSMKDDTALAGTDDLTGADVGITIFDPYGAQVDFMSADDLQGMYDTEVAHLNEGGRRMPAEDYRSSKDVSRVMPTDLIGKLEPGQTITDWANTEELQVVYYVEIVNGTPVQMMLYRYVDEDGNVVERRVRQDSIAGQYVEKALAQFKAAVRDGPTSMRNLLSILGSSTAIGAGAAGITGFIPGWSLATAGGAGLLNAIFKEGAHADNSANSERNGRYWMELAADAEGYAAVDDPEVFVPNNPQGPLENPDPEDEDWEEDPVIIYLPVEPTDPTDYTIDAQQAAEGFRPNLKQRAAAAARLARLLELKNDPEFMASLTQTQKDRLDTEIDLLRLIISPPPFVADGSDTALDDQLAAGLVVAEEAADTDGLQTDEEQAMNDANVAYIQAEQHVQDTMDLWVDAQFTVDELEDDIAVLEGLLADDPNNADLQQQLDDKNAELVVAKADLAEASQNFDDARVARDAAGRDWAQARYNFYMKQSEEQYSEPGEEETKSGDDGIPENAEARDARNEYIRFGGSGSEL